LLLAAVLLPPARAAAGGMVLPVRGVRTLERGGAFVAGADDADALWLDPAGLAHVHGKGTKAFLPWQPWACILMATFFVSGGFVFAAFASREAAQAALDGLPASIKGFVARGLEHHPLREVSGST